MRALILVLLTLLLPHPAAADIKVRVEYHAPTDLFALMDGVSGWLFNDPAYHVYWADRFGWSPEDEAITAQYKRYRDRTYHDPAQNDPDYRARNDGIFGARSAHSTETDPLGEHFIAARSIDDALARFDEIMPDEDAVMLRAFYAHFEPHWRLVLEESESYNVGRAVALNAQLVGDRVDAFLARLTAFYRVTEDLAFTARYVWWPPINRSMADITGRTFFLRNHPQTYPDQTGVAGDVIHEAVHYISANQPRDQKVALTETYLKRCPATVSGTVYDLLEEPMATAWGNAAFTKYGLGQRVDPAKQWYRRPLPDVMARLLWLHVDVIYETDETIMDGIVVSAAEHCAKLLAVVGTLKRSDQ